MIIMIKPHCVGVGIYTPTGQPLILRGFNASLSSTVEDDIKWIAENGYNSVRIDATWRDMQSSATAPIDFTQLDNIINWCEKYGVYALIVNFFWHFSEYFSFSGYGKGWGLPSWLVSGGGYPNSAVGVSAFANEWYSKTGYGATTWAKIVDFWKQVALRYANRTCVWGYELLNEPLVGGSFDAQAPNWLYQRYSELIAEIRVFDPNAVIVCHDVFYANQATFPANCLNAVNTYGHLPPNTVWTRSEYIFYEGGNGSVVSRQNTIKQGANINLGLPHIISESGFRQPSDYPNDVTDYDDGMILMDDNMRSVLNANGSGAIHYYIYAKGNKGGYRGPRNADGTTNTEVNNILQTWLTEGVTPLLIDSKYLTLISQPTSISPLNFIIGTQILQEGVYSIPTDNIITITTPKNVNK